MGGAELSVQILAKGLIKEGHKVTVITLKEPRAREEKEVINGITVYRIPMTNIFWPFTDSSYHKPFILKRASWIYLDLYNKSMAKTIRRILEKESPDLIHTNNIMGFSVSIWNVARTMGFPLVHTVRDYSLLCPLQTFKKGQSCPKPCITCFPYLTYKKKISKAVNIVIGISYHILNKHLNWGLFRSSKSAVIYNAVRQIQASERAIRENTIKKTLRIGYLGRLAPHKGIEDLLNATEQARKILPLQVLVAGKGELKYETHLHRKARNLPVSFLGFAPAKTLFNQIDILVVPSRWDEPLSRAVLEAYSYGIPVIASARGGIPEIVDNGRTGLLYNSDNPKELINALIKICEQQRKYQEMSVLAYEKSKKFTVESHVKRYIQIYLNAMKQNKTFM